MPAPYGVVDSGFSRKILAEILAELELSEQAKWGAGVVLDASSPLGQLNGIFADGAAEVWEIAEAVYQAYDPSIATGAQLDRIASLRGLTRLVGESDADFRQRINNLYIGNVRTRELYNRLSTIAGVTWLNITENATARTHVNGMPPHSLAIAVEGGTDADVAQTIWDYTTAGIELVGNTTINHLDNDGYCRAIFFSRPTAVTVKIHITAVIDTNRCECSATSTSDIINDLVTSLTQACSFYNGMVLSGDTLNKYLSGQTGLLVKCITFARDGDTLGTKPITFGLDERPTVTASDITVTIVSDCA